MKHWFKTKYGLAPYKDVLLVEFSYSVKNQSENSKKQYDLLLNDNVIQAHLEFSKKVGKMVLENNSNPEQLLKKEGFEYKIISRQTISYEKVLESNNFFKL
jgi:predicted metal-binding protein